ncbi:ABC transporter transmembrane domain-containing protein, partial [Oleiphilus sp. HI0123]
SQVKEFDSIKQFFTAATMTALADVPFAIIFLLVIASVGGQLALVPLIAAAFLLLYGYVVHFPIKKVVDLMQQAAAEKNSVLVESLSGIETIKSLNAQGRQQGLWERALVRMSLLGARAKHLTDSVSIVSASVMQLSTMAI